jgi:hypothetical protein
MEIGGACSRVMRTLNFTQEQINAVHDAAWSGNYAHALHVYGRYIKIEDEE